MMTLNHSLFSSQGTAGILIFVLGWKKRDKELGLVSLPSSEAPGR